MTRVPAARRPYAARVPLETRREQLLDAALAIIVREGYAGISIDAIAKQAGVTRPVVYGAFDDLGDLLGSLLDRQQLRAVTQLAEVLPESLPDGDPDAFLLATVHALIDRVLADPDTWRPILVAGDSTPAVVRDRIDGDRQRIRRQIADLLAVGIERRGGPDLDVEVASYAAIAVLESFGRLLLEGRLEGERMVGFAAALLRGLR